MEVRNINGIAVIELFRTMETVGVVDRAIQEKLLKAYKGKDIKSLAEGMKEYFELLADKRRLFHLLNQNLNWMKETGQDSSEAATCEFLISPVLQQILRENYNPLHVRFPSRAKDEPIRADYIVNKRLLIEAKRLKDEVCKDREFCDSLSFKESGENKDGHHLSQAVYYFVEIKYGNKGKNRIDTLQHLALTNGKEWFVVENADKKISAQKVQDLPELNGQTLEGEFFCITDWNSYTKLLKKLEEIIGK